MFAVLSPDDDDDDDDDGGVEVNEEFGSLKSMFSSSRSLFKLDCLFRAMWCSHSRRMPKNF